MTDFSPQLGDLYTLIAIYATAFVGLTFAAFRIGKNRHPDPRRRVLLPMLCYFLALLALMGLLGSFWTVFKFPTVVVTDRQIILDDQAFPRPNPRDLRLENNSGAGTRQSTRVLLLQTEDRRTWAFPEDRYPVNEMMRALRD